MAEESNVWKDVRELLEQIKEKVLSSTPSEIRTSESIDNLTLQIALPMYWRCVGLFRSVLILLDNNQPEEALILARSLFAESLRLMELDAAGTERAGILYGHYAQSLERNKWLLHKAKRWEVVDDITNQLRSIENQKGELETYRKRHGIGKSGKFSSEENAAIKLGRQKNLWTFELSHRMVHGELVSQMFRRRPVGSGGHAIYSYTNYTSDPKILAGVGEFAAESMTHALHATANIFGWTVSSELQELIKKLKRCITDS